MSALDTHLPFLEGGTDGDSFETFCRDFLSRSPGFERVRRWGVSGDAQDGVDILADYQGAPWAFQCKREKQFGPQKAQAALDTATHPADQFVLLLARTATRATRSLVEKGGWKLWDADDLSQKVRELPPSESLPLVRTHFGAETARTFLGVDRDTPWIPLEDHFAPLLKGDRLFTHQWPMAGRDRELRALDAFLQNDPWVAVLPGRGGVGKSRLVLEAGRRFAEAGTAVSVVEESRVVRPEHIERIPQAPSVLIVDDAHRRDDLLLLARIVLQARESGYPVKLLLATRPHGVDAVRSALTRAGVDAPAITEFEPLGDLDAEGLLALAKAALGPRGADDALVRRLVRAVDDSPLVLTVGGSLVARGTVDPSRLGTDASFRTTVLDRFQDEALGRVPGTVPANQALEMLRVIAAAGPLHTDQTDALTAAAKVSNTDPVAFRQALSVLEEEGILLRRGRQLRVSPDVLADHILAGAALTRTGESTGYAERVYTAMGRYAASDILRNLAELDWRQRRGGAKSSLLVEVWAWIEEEFRMGATDARLRILQLVQDATYYLPHRVLRLCQLAVDAPAPEPSGTDELATYWGTQDDVLHALPDLLRRVGFTLDVLPDALDLLWDLAQGEGDLLRPYPEEARKVIETIAAPSPRKPLAVQTILLDRAEHWSRRQARSLSAWPGPPQPLPPMTIAAVVAPVVRWRSDDSWAEGGSFYISHVTPRAALPLVRVVRRRALSLLESFGVQGGLPAAAAAIDVLVKQAKGPLGPDKPHDEDTLWAFRSEARWALVSAARILDAHPHPYLADLVWRRLQWFADRGPDGPRRRAARRLRCRAAEVPGWRLQRALHRPHDRWTGGAEEEESDGSEHFIQSELSQRVAEARRFLGDAAPPADAADHIAEILVEATTLESWISESEMADVPQPWSFLTALAQLDPAYGRALADAFAQKGEEFATVVAALAAGAREGDGDAAELRMLVTGTPLQRRAAVQAIQNRFWQGTATPDDWEILSPLLADEDLSIRLAAVRAWRGGFNTQPDRARPLLTIIWPDSSVGIAEEMLTVFRQTGDILPTPHEREHLLQVLAPLPSLESYYVLSFLTTLASDSPRTVFGLLTDRIAHTVDIGSAVPDVYRGSIFEKAPQAERAALLPEAMRLAADAEIPYDAVRLVQSLAHDHPPAVREVILSTLREGDDKLARVALDLVASLPEHLPLADLDYVRDLLDAAEQGGGRTRVETATRRVRAAATSGSRSRGFGEPSALDVQIRDRARQRQAEVASDPRLASLYEQIAADAQASIDSDLASDEEFAGRG